MVLEMQTAQFAVIQPSIGGHVTCRWEMIGHG